MKLLNNIYKKDKLQYDIKRERMYKMENITMDKLVNYCCLL